MSALEKVHPGGAELTSELYDRCATRWERHEPVLLSDYTARPFVLEWCDPVAGLDVLDLGCGEGYVARQLRERGAGRLLGIDVSAEMVGRAAAADPTSDYRVGDATNLSDLQDASVDLVAAVFLFNYLDRAATAAAMREVHRVLRPGGRFVFTVPHPSLPFLREKGRPFFFDRGELGYFSARDHQLEGEIWRRDGEGCPVRCVHKTFEDYFGALGASGFAAMPEMRELRVTDQHIELDREFFGPLRDLPLHVMFRLTKAC